jgi:RND family efflux transporter MFP subunit
VTPRRLRTILPIAVLIAGALVTWLLLATRPRVAGTERERRVTRGRGVDVAPRTVKLSVSTHGTVAPRTESDLIPEVSGPVVRVSPSLVSGGFFEAGDVLLEIDPRDYEVALERARAALVRAGSEHRRARKDLERRRGLADRGVASDAQMDDAENAERVAVADLREARSALEQAERDLERTRVRAPFKGRVREENVGVGQFVNRGAPVAKLYATDYVEVRLPIPDGQLAYLDLPLARDAAGSDASGPPVRLHASFAGGDHTWMGTIERTEGEIDPRTRMVHVVARVEAPYERAEGDARPPLAVGLFVRAEIEGREVPGVVVLPRSALHGGERVWIVDDDGRLRERSVEVLRATREEVVVTGGLQTGEKVVLSPLEAAVEGMAVEADRASEETRS